MSTVLEQYTKEDLLSRTSIRQGEERLGQSIAAVNESDWTNANSLPYKFIIVGIEEDFGVRANHGRGGADRAFQSFLNYFPEHAGEPIFSRRIRSDFRSSGSNCIRRRRQY